MRRTLPCSLPTTIQSPTLIRRSMSRMSPETKLLTIDCRPKPMPAERTRHDGEVRHVEAGVETDNGAATPMPA